MGRRAVNAGNPVNIGDTDENADWIKTAKNRESEKRIHEALAEELAEQEPEPQEGDGAG